MDKATIVAEDITELVDTSDPQYYDFDKYIFGVDPDSDLSPLEQDSGIFPTAHHKYVVYNLGRVPVDAEVRYGTKFGWIGTVVVDTVQPLEKRKFNDGDRGYYVTGLRVFNKDLSTRAIFSCDVGTLVINNDPGLNFDTNKLLKDAFSLGVKYIPYVGSAFSSLINVFWPENKPNVWEQVQDKISGLLQQNVIEIITGILEGSIAQFQKRITSLQEQLEPSALRKSDETARHYMNIAEDLIGFEENFKFKSLSDQKNVNFRILPHFSSVIMMKLNFYNIGITNQNEIGLSDKDVDNIKRYAKSTTLGTDGAIDYITKMYKERVDDCYQTADSTGIFDSIMTVRTHIITHGMEYIPIWNNLLENPNSMEQVYNTHISYSRHYGRVTPNITLQSLGYDVIQPLTPKLLPNGKRDKLKSVEVYIWRIHHGAGPPKIGGMKIVFENEDTYVMGTVTNEKINFDLNGAYINKMRVEGFGALDYLGFTLSDGRYIFMGTGSGTNQDFEMTDHHIVSICLNSDAESLGGQAANIAVSYQLTTESKSMFKSTT